MATLIILYCISLSTLCILSAVLTVRVAEYFDMVKLPLKVRAYPTYSVIIALLAVGYVAHQLFITLDIGLQFLWDPILIGIIAVSAYLTVVVISPEEEYFY